MPAQLLGDQDSELWRGGQHDSIVARERPKVLWAKALWWATQEARRRKEQRLAEQQACTNVYCPRAHAHITGLDATLASEVPGFIRLVDGSTLGASNQATLEGYGELLAFDGQRGQVTFFGQAIAMVIAESEEAARAAARAVVVYYTDLPAVVTIAEAVEQGSLYDTTTPLFPPNFGKIEYGGVTNALATAAVVVEEDVSIGSQDHAYLRTT